MKRLLWTVLLVAGLVLGTLPAAPAHAVTRNDGTLAVELQATTDTPLNVPTGGPFDWRWIYYDLSGPGLLVTTAEPGITRCDGTGAGLANAALDITSFIIDCTGLGASAHCVMFLTRAGVAAYVNGWCEVTAGALYRELDLQGALTWTPTSNPITSWTLAGTVVLYDELPPV